MHSVFKTFVQTLDSQEEQFRTVIRHQTHPHLSFKKFKYRKIIDTDGKVYQYRLGVYHYYTFNDKGQKIRRQITYYHNPYLQELKRSKYSLEIKRIVNDIWINGGKKPWFIPKSTFLSWNKKKYQKQELDFCDKLGEKIKLSLENKDLCSLKKYQIKPWHNNILYVEIDDTYKRIQHNKKNKKLMCRMITFNLYNKRKKKYECFNNVQIYFNKEERLTKYDEQNDLVELVKYIRNTFYDKNMIVCIKGDGAKNISQMGKSFQYQVIDKYHLKRYIINTFLLPKWSNNKDLKHFNRVFSIKNHWRFWHHIINKFSVADWDKLYVKFRKWFKEKIFSSYFNKAFDKFLKYINNNKHIIFEIPTFIDKTSHTESSIRNLFKRFIQKTGATYSLNSIVNLVRINFNKSYGLLQIF